VGDDPVRIWLLFDYFFFDSFVDERILWIVEVLKFDVSWAYEGVGLFEKYLLKLLPDEPYLGPVSC